jgi:TonB family protein
VNALDRRHPSQRVYYRNVRVAMAIAVLTHGAILAFVSVPSGSTRTVGSEVLRVVEASGALLAGTMDSPGGPLMGPTPDAPATRATEPFRAVDEPVRTVAATDAAPSGGDRGSTRARTAGGGVAAGSGVGGGVTGHDEGTEVFYAYDIAPRALHPVEPEYPQAARAAGLEGTVVVNVNIDDRGRILRAWVAQADAADILVAAALDAAYQFEFQPGTWRGEPVRCTVAIPFQFHLNQTMQVEGN